MFRSQTRSLLYTQYEHGRLAGTLAALWGNADFDRPALDFDAFVAGVALHDWAYGLADTIPIGEATEKAWLEIVRKGVGKRYHHPTTEIVIKLHLRRLLQMKPSPEQEALIAEIDERIDGRLDRSGAPLAEFQRADKITRLCDMISFDFCFETPRQRTYEVSCRQGSEETIDITYEIGLGGEVLVDPWPFAAPSISGVMVAFAREDYPDEQDPLVVSYSIRPL